MNHNKKQKNFNRKTSHRKAMFENMLNDFKKRGHITTTLKKAKYLKPKLQSEIDDKIIFVRLYNRKGDNAPMAKLLTENYINKKFNSKKSKEKK